MTYSDNAVRIIKKWEGCKLKAYTCPAGVVTIGFGSTRWFDGTAILIGMKITMQQAEELLKLEIDKCAKSLDNMNLGINQNQFDAIVSFMFNCGIFGFKRSTLCKIIKSNPNSEAIKKEWARWCTSKGKVLKGLQNRRKDEIELYFQ